jgi:hypothetical protein
VTTAIHSIRYTLSVNALFLHFAAIVCVPSDIPPTSPRVKHYVFQAGYYCKELKAQKKEETQAL